MQPQTSFGVIALDQYSVAGGKNLNKHVWHANTGKYTRNK